MMRNIFLFPVCQIIKNTYKTTFINKCINKVRTDKPRPPGDHDPHRISLRPRNCPFPELQFPTEPIPLSSNDSLTLVSSGCVFRSTVNPTLQQSLRGNTAIPTAPSERYPFLTE